MKAEIDSLQISAADATKPWYRQASVLIAFLALIFSAGTTFYSVRRTHDQDVHNAKIELRDLIQRLTSFPIRNLDLDQKYPTDTAARAQASSLLNTENIVLAKQAVDVINEIPDEVTSVEYFAVASSLAFSGDYGQTSEFYKRALDSADDALDFSTAARSLGLAAFSRGDVHKGRAAFEQALNVFDRFPTASSVFRANTLITTEMAWSSSELSARNCSGALEHLKRAEGLLPPLGDGLLGRRLRGQTEDLRRRMEVACP